MAKKIKALSKPRLLKIGYSYYEHRREGRWTGSKAVPFLRLSGIWLDNAGFAVGQHVRVHVSKNRITIRVEP